MHSLRNSLWFALALGCSGSKDGGQVSSPPAIELRVLTVVPASGATNVRDDAVRVNFNTDLDPDSLDENALVVRSKLGREAGTVDYDPQARVVSWTSVAPLAPMTAYEVVLSAGIRAREGQRMTQEIRWSFQTSRAQGWSLPEVLGDGYVLATDASAPGKVAVLLGGRGGPARLVERNSRGDWEAPEMVIESAIEDATMSFDTNGNPAIVYQRIGQNTLWLIKRNSHGSWSSPEFVWWGPPVEMAHDGHGGIVVSSGYTAVAIHPMGRSELRPRQSTWLRVGRGRDGRGHAISVRFWCDYLGHNKRWHDEPVRYCLDARGQWESCDPVRNGGSPERIATAWGTDGSALIAAFDPPYGQKPWHWVVHRLRGDGRWQRVLSKSEDAPVMVEVAVSPSGGDIVAYSTGNRLYSFSRALRETIHEWDPRSQGLQDHKVAMTKDGSAFVGWLGKSAHTGPWLAVRRRDPNAGWQPPEALMRFPELPTQGLSAVADGLGGVAMIWSVGRKVYASHWQRRPR